MNYTNNNINELGIQFKNGNAGAFEQLYNSSIQWVRSDVYKHIKADDVDDCVQDIYVKVYKNINLFEPEKGTFNAWFNRLVTNETINFARRYHTAIAENTDYSIDDDESLFEIADINSTPEEVVENEETRSILASLLGELNEKQKACISMVFLDEMSYKAAANVLGISEGTVKSRVFNGLKNIRTSIEAMRKRGVAVFSVAPIPTFIYLLKVITFVSEPQKVAATWSAVAGTVNIAGTTAAIGAGVVGTGVTSTAAVTTKAVVAKGFFGKIALWTIKKKIIAIIVTVLVTGGIVGGTVAIVNSSSSTPKKSTSSVALDVTPVISEIVVAPSNTPIPTPTEIPVPEEEKPYQEACALFNQEKYADAKVIFITIIDYKDSKEKLEICNQKLAELENKEAIKQYLSFLDENYINVVSSKYDDEIIYKPDEYRVYLIDVTGDGVKELLTVETVNKADNLRIYKIIDGKLTLINDETLTVRASEHHTTYYIDDNGTFIYCLAKVDEGGTIQYFIKEYDAENHSFSNRRILLEDELVEPDNFYNTITTYYNEYDREITKEYYNSKKDSLLNTAKIIVQSNVYNGSDETYILEGKYTLEEAVDYLIKEAGDDLKNYKKLSTYLSLDRNVIKGVYATKKNKYANDSKYTFKSQKVYTMPTDGKTAVLVVQQYDYQDYEWVFEYVDDGYGNKFRERVEKPCTATLTCVHCFVPGYDVVTTVLGESIYFENNLIHAQGRANAFPEHWCNVDNDYYIIENGKFKQVYHYMIDYDDGYDLVSKELYAYEDGATNAIVFSGTGIELSVAEKEIEALKNTSVNVKEVDYKNYLIFD